MYLKDYLLEDKVFCGLDCSTKQELLVEMVEMLKTSLSSLDKELAIKNLFEKEGVFSTGVGGGIAIPHAVIPSLDKTVLSIGQLKAGIDYGSVDGEPVNLVFLLLSPAGKTQEHIKLLARIARLCFGREFVGRMKKAASCHELFMMVIEEDSVHEE